MSDYIGNIWTFKTAQFRIEVNAYYDYDLDLSFDETGEVSEKLNSGEYIGFFVEAAVFDSRSTKIATDSLYGCIYPDILRFKDHIGINKYNKLHKSSCSSYFSGMVREVVRNSRIAIHQNATHYTNLSQQIRKRK